jgi:hypothetical protein
MSNAQRENKFHVQYIDWLVGVLSEMGKVLVFSSSESQNIATTIAQRHDC